MERVCCWSHSSWVLFDALCPRCQTLPFCDSDGALSTFSKHPCYSTESKSSKILLDHFECRAEIGFPGIWNWVGETKTRLRRLGCTVYCTVPYNRVYTGKANGHLELIDGVCAWRVPFHPSRDMCRLDSWRQFPRRWELRKGHHWKRAAKFMLHHRTSQWCPRMLRRAAERKVTARWADKTAFV